MTRTSTDRRALLEALGIQPDRHPDGGLCAYDQAAREWRVEVATTNGGRRIIRRHGATTTDPGCAADVMIIALMSKWVADHLDPVVLGDPMAHRRMVELPQHSTRGR